MQKYIIKAAFDTYDEHQRKAATERIDQGEESAYKKLTLLPAEYDKIIDLLAAAETAKTRKQLYADIEQVNKSLKLDSIIDALAEIGWLNKSGDGDAVTYITTDAGREVLGLGEG